jgi:AAA15 family ATPase/GTPase
MGHVESVDIEGFKCLKSVSLECGQFNLITGRNGTGKSSVLEAIELGFRPSSLSRHKSALSKTIDVESNKAKIKIKGNNIAREVDIKTIEDEEVPNKIDSLLNELGDFHERLANEASDEVQENIIEQENYNDYFPPDKYSEEAKEDIIDLVVDEENYTYSTTPEWANKADTKFKSMVDLYHSEDISLLDDFLEGFFHGDNPKEMDIKFVVDVKTGKAGLETDDEMEKVRVRDFLRDHDIFPNLESFSFDELVFDEDGEQYAIPYDFLGDGTKTIIGIVWQLVADDEIPDVVLLEEPENHLHPGYVKELVPFLIDFAREEDVQLFVTSHNVDFISELLSDSLSEDHREWLAEEFRLIQMTNLSPKQFDYDRAKHHTEELHLDLRGL